MASEAGAGAQNDVRGGGQYLSLGQAERDGTLAAVQRECEEDPEVVTSAPHRSYHRRLDATQAARNPVPRWVPPSQR